MASINRVILIGTLGRDPEVKYTPQGTAVCALSIATNRSYKDSSGQKCEETEWHRISTFGNTAEACGKYLAKGRSVYVEGRIHTRKWQDKETGAERYSTDIVAESVQFLGSKDSQGAEKPKANEYAKASQGAAKPSTNTGSVAEVDDDIPF